MFLARLTAAERHRITARIRKLIDNRTDDVRLYPVPPGADLDVSGPPLLPDGVVITDGPAPGRPRRSGTGGPPARRVKKG